MENIIEEEKYLDESDEDLMMIPNKIEE